MGKRTKEIYGGEPYEYVSLGEHVVSAVGVCGGEPTFKYTRILISGMLDRRAAGENIDSIVRGYRGRVSREAITEAILLADGSLNIRRQHGQDAD